MNQAGSSVQISTSSAAATRSVAAEVARWARGGDLILLIGDLGAGKTVFAQGFATGIGVEDRVTSPTFALVQSYDGDLIMNHLDVYRIAHPSEVADLGLSELLDDDAVTLIEWGDMITAHLPNDFLEVHLLAVELPPQGGETTAKAEGETPDDPSASADGAAADDAGIVAEEVFGRQIVLTARGPSWRPRIGALRSAILASGVCDGVD